VGNKTILAIICLALITLALIFTHSDDKLIYAGVAGIALLGGAQIVRNNIPKP
jgi:hypothetical protein